MSATWEQLEGAVLSLVRSGVIKDRLTEAFRKHLGQVQANDLPDALRAEFLACHAALTREPPLRGEDAVRATVRKMSNEEADRVACSVVRLFSALAQESLRASARALADAVDAQAIAQRAVAEHAVHEDLVAALDTAVVAEAGELLHDSTLHESPMNGAPLLSGATSNGAAALNGITVPAAAALSGKRNGAKASRKPKSVPQVISLYAVEA